MTRLPEQSPGVVGPVEGSGNSALGGVCKGAVGSLKVVNQPSMFWMLFTRLPPPALNPMSKLDVLPVVLTFVPDGQLEQVTTSEELNRLFRSTVWSVHPPETMQSFTPKKCWMSTLPLSALA